MPITIDLANRLLERESWAREKLAARAGQTARLNVGPLHSTVTVAADGWLREAEAAPDLTLTVAAFDLPALLARPERWNELVTAEGDPAFAATLGELALALPWFVEELFTKAFGRVAGPSLADIGRRLLTLPGYAAERFGTSAASYVADEARPVVTHTELRDFAAEIAAVAARVEALAARIEALGKSR